MAQVLVLPSPLLGVEGWERACHLLAAAGHQVELADPALPHQVAEVLAGFGGLLRGRPCVLTAHSNAGNYLPSLVSAAPAGTSAVFVDCEVPPRHGMFGAATGPRRDRLRSMADDAGRLPPWPLWWEESAWEELVPDRSARERIEAAAPRLKLSYFDQSVEVPADWWQRSIGYLRFQESFEPQVEIAASYGWPVSRLHGTHLHMVNDPEETVGALSSLMSELTA